MKWKPGVSANPGGAPKGKRLSTSYLEMLDLSLDELKRIQKSKTSTAREISAATWALQTMVGDDKARGQGLDRTEGGVRQVVVQLPGDVSGLNDDELNQLWQQRQSQGQTSGS